MSDFGDTSDIWDENLDDGDPSDERDDPVRPKGFQLGGSPISDALRKAIFVDGVVCVAFDGKFNEGVEEFDHTKPAFYTIDNDTPTAMSTASLAEPQFIAAGRMSLEEEHHVRVLDMCYWAGLTDGEAAYVLHFDGFSVVGLLCPEETEHPGSVKGPLGVARLMSIFRWGGSNHRMLEIMGQMKQSGPVLGAIVNRDRENMDWPSINTSELEKLTFEMVM